MSASDAKADSTLGPENSGRVAATPSGQQAALQFSQKSSSSQNATFKLAAAIPLGREAAEPKRNLRCAVDLFFPLGPFLPIAALAALWVLAINPGNPLLTTLAIFALTFFLGRLCILALGPHGFMDVPGGRRAHPSPIPRVGGMACFAALLLSSSLLQHPLPLSWIQWGALGAMVLTGALDDRFNLSARPKVLVSLIIACLLAWASLSDLAGILPHIDVLTFQIPYDPLTAFALLLMLFWGMPQAFNLIDGADGLTIGYAFIVAIILYLQGTIDYVLPLILLGLLPLNWPRPRLFLGDCGALGLGLLFAILAHQAFSATNANAILWLFAYPILDVTMVVAIRIAHGQSPLRGDRNHLHHQLIDRLGTQAFLAVPILWVIAGLCASRALGWTVLPWCGLAALLGMTIAFFTTSWDKRNAH